MKKTLLRIALYSVIAVIVSAAFLSVPGYKVEVTPLGGVLSTYFYHKHAATNDLQPHFKSQVDSVTDYKLKKFYKKLAWEPKQTLIDYNSDVDTTWQLYDHSGVAKTNYLEYWQAVRPAMRDFYSQTIAPINVAAPVVHFRCSDSPCNRYPLYHLTKASTVEWMADIVKQRGYNKVILLFCNKHRRFKNNRCGDFVKFYEQIFNKAGIRVERQCHDVYQDFALMFYTPLLISLNQSNYSFMAGIAKDPNNYITSNLGREFDGKYLPHDRADWIMDSRMPLLHKEIANYQDVKEVLSKLRDNN